MKKILFLMILGSIATSGYGQEANNENIKSIPPKENSKPISTPLKSKPKKAKGVVKVKPDPYKINPGELFNNTNLYKKETNTDGVFYRKNQYLGSYKTKTETATIECIDAAYIDGDMVRIYLNDKVILPEMSLNGVLQGIKIKLVKGINKIDIEALNEGSASPNTAQFKISDDSGLIISADQWNVGTGYKATFILIKE